MKKKPNSVFLRDHIIQSLCLILVLLAFISTPSGINGLREERVINGKFVNSLLNEPGGSKSLGSKLVLDNPKIRVIKYFVRNDDPYAISDDLFCVNGQCSDEVQVKPEVRLGKRRNEDSEYVVRPNVTRIHIECWSRSGAVEWSYSGKGFLKELSVESSRTVHSVSSTSSYKYSSTLILESVSDQATGEYTCRIKNKPYISNTFYLFVPEEDLDIYPIGSKISVVPPSHAATFWIPCRTNKRHLAMNLYKQVSNGRFRKISLSGKVAYDPYRGFRLPVTKAAIGSYQCRLKSAYPSVRVKRNTPELQTYIKAQDATGRQIPKDLIKERDPFIVTRVPSLNILPPAPLPDHTLYHRPRRKHRIRQKYSFKQLPYFHLDKVAPNYPVTQHPKNVRLTRTKAPTGYFGAQENYFSTKPNWPIWRGPEAHNNDKHETTPKPKSKISEDTFYSRMDLNDSEPSENEEEDQYSAERSPIQNKLATIPPHTAQEGLSGALAGILSPTTVIIAEKLRKGNFMDTMQCVVKKMFLGQNATCNGVTLPHGTFASLANNINLKNYYEASSEVSSKEGSSSNEITNSHPHSLKSQDDSTVRMKGKAEVIMEVEVLPPVQNKFYPKESIFYTTVPFFVKWQTKFSDFSSYTNVKHTLGNNSEFRRFRSKEFQNGIEYFEVLKLPDGMKHGKIKIDFMGKDNEILHHQWEFRVIDEYEKSQLGLTHEYVGSNHRFKCQGLKSSRPHLTVTPLTIDGHKDDSQEKSEKTCGRSCVYKVSSAKTLKAECNYNGFSQVLRIPEYTFQTGRPYFIQRHRTLNITLEKENANNLVLPCVLNNPNADIYLMKKWSNDTVTDITDFATFDIKMGFSLNTTGIPVDEVIGEYYCTSFPSMVDLTDLVTFVVQEPLEHSFHPEAEVVHGVPPFKFMWESSDDLMVRNKSAGTFYSGVFAGAKGPRPYVGVFEISSLFMEPNETGVVEVVRVKDNSTVHKWAYKFTKETGVWFDKKKNVFMCQTISSRAPALYSTQCSNLNACEIKKKFYDKDDIHKEERNKDNSPCGEGCMAIKIWNHKPSGYIHCHGDGVDKTLLYSLSHNSTIVPEDDVENFKNLKAPVIENEPKILDVGDTVDYTCIGNLFFHSKGFQWAIEYYNGTNSYKDPLNNGGREKLLLNAIHSSIKIEMDSRNIKKVWCLAPLADSADWAKTFCPVYFKRK